MVLPLMGLWFSTIWIHWYWLGPMLSLLPTLLSRLRFGDSVKLSSLQFSLVLPMLKFKETIYLSPMLFQIFGSPISLPLLLWMQGSKVLVTLIISGRRIKLWIGWSAKVTRCPILLIVFLLFSIFFHYHPQGYFRVASWLGPALVLLS